VEGSGGNKTETEEGVKRLLPENVRKKVTGHKTMRVKKLLSVPEEGIAQQRARWVFAYNQL
jgi:hypothetical protein